MPDLAQSTRRAEFEPAAIDETRTGEDILSYFEVELSGPQLESFRGVMQNWAAHKERAEFEKGKE